MKTLLSSLIIALCPAILVFVVHTSIIDCTDYLEPLASAGAVFCFSVICLMIEAGIDWWERKQADHYRWLPGEAQVDEDRDLKG